MRRRAALQHLCLVAVSLFLNRARRGDNWLAMRKLPPAPVPYAKALPAPVATWLAMRKLPLSQWGAVRVCLFCFEFSLGRGAKAPSPPQREFEAKKTDTHGMHAAPANSAMFISQVSLFCFEISLGRGAAPRCNVCAWPLSLSLSQPRMPQRYLYHSTRCYAVSRQSSLGTSCRF